MSESKVNSATVDYDLARLCAMETVKELRGRGVFVGGSPKKGFVIGDLSSDEDLALVAKLPLITDLSCEKNSVGDSGLRCLSGRHIKRLSLAETHITGAGLAILPEIIGLEDLELQVDTGPIEAAEAISRCRDLARLTVFNSPFDDISLAKLRNVGQFEAMDFQSCPLQSGSDVLQDANRLTSLGLDGCPVVDDFLRQLRGLEIETLSTYDSQLTDSCSGDIRTMPRIKNISVIGSHMSEIGVSDIILQCDLEYIFIDAGMLTERVIACSRGRPGLRQIVVKRTLPEHDALIQRLQQVASPVEIVGVK